MALKNSDLRNQHVERSLFHRLKTLKTDEKLRFQLLVPETVKDTEEPGLPVNTQNYVWQMGFLKSSNAGQRLRSPVLPIAEK